VYGVIAELLADSVHSLSAAIAFVERGELELRFVERELRERDTEEANGQ
jgi:hypothetical protein